MIFDRCYAIIKNKYRDGKAVTMKLKPSSGLYLSESLEKERESLLAQLKKGNLRKLGSMLLFTMNTAGNLEYYSFRMLKQKAYKDAEIRIFALAKDDEEAKALLEKMMQECMECGFELRVVDYLCSLLEPKITE